MEFDNYQEDSVKMAVYPGRGNGEPNQLVYVALGLAGEAGEVANEVKKIIRDDEGEVTKERKEKLVLEMGDVLWYMSALAEELEVDLSYIAARNIMKLEDRKARNALKGEGGER